MTTDKTSTAVREPYDAIGPVDAPNPPAAPATLATVKHGGCVQLPSTTAHVLVNAEHLERVLVCAEGNHFDDCMADKNTTMTQAIEQMRGALSAQPSPGSQGEVLSLAEHITDHLCHNEYDIGGRPELLACVVEALAARQPVGQGDALLREVSSQLESLDCGACIGSDAPMEDLHGRIAAHLAARQPVGEPVLWVSPDVLDAMAIHRAQDFPAGGMGLACPAGSATVPLYLGSPAQAVDLGPASIPDTPEVRDILGRPNFWCSPWANVLRMRGDAIPRKAEEEQAAVIRFMLNHYLAHGADWAETAGAELDAIRKADSQAVGNG